MTEPRTFTLDLPIHLPTVNVYTRMFWAEKARLRRSIAHAVAMLLMQQGWARIDAPMQQCAVHVRRWSRKEPDPCERDSCAKLLLDVLQPKSKRCPDGLGLIAEDNSSCLKSIHVEHVPKKGPRAVVTITELV